MDKKDLDRSVKEVEKSISSGEAYFLKTERGLFPLTALERFVKEDNEKKSKQLKLEEWGAEYGLMPYPFPPSSLLLFKENCASLDACTKQVAEDSAGQGMRIELREGLDKDDDDEKKIVQDFIDRMNEDGDSLRAIIKKAIEDWASIGWFALEVTRDFEGNVENVYHVPAHTVKVQKSGKKYCQQKGNRRVWFKRFGEDQDISRIDGKPIAKGSKRMTANEMIFYKNYYAPSSYYGAPNFLSSVGAVKGLIGIRDYNISFFDNYGVPAALVKLTGKWKSGSVQKIIEFLDIEIKGSDKSHKTLVLKVPEGGEAEWIQLSVEKKEGSFTLQRKDFREDVLVCYRMPPYRIGIAEAGSLGGNTAAEQTRIYLDSVIEPIQSDIEDILSNIILKEGLGCENYWILFEDIDVRDVEREARICNVLFGIASITPNEIRERLNLGEAYEGGDKFYISSSYLPIDQIGEDVEGLVSNITRDERQLIALREELKTLITEARGSLGKK